MPQRRRLRQPSRKPDVTASGMFVVKLVEAESDFRRSLEEASAELVATWSRKPDLHHLGRIH
jgi:hypothetical protein